MDIYAQKCIPYKLVYTTAVSRTFTAFCSLCPEVMSLQKSLTLSHDAASVAVILSK